MFLLISTIVLFSLYSVLIIYYWISWRSVPVFVPPPVTPRVRLSVIIPARNEEKAIVPLLQALKKQTYPAAMFETIVVDDQSTDNTSELVRQFAGVKLIRLDEININSYKKKAIERGVETATGEWMVTTDADCIPGPGWLELLARTVELHRPVFIAAPVSIHANNSLLQIFQSLDFMILQGITGAAVHKGFHAMSNGANQAYEKIIFRDVGGFSEIDHIASGDDLLLVQKIAARYPDKIFYLKSKDAIVTTEPMKSWKDFFSQRIRWASKATHYKDPKMIAVLMLVYLFNLVFLALFIAGFWSTSFWYWLAVLWVAKTIIEFPFVYALASFFNKRSIMPVFFFLQPLHIFYTIVSGLFGQFGKYEWKGRRVR
jgi:poly-beta-1,6-N-acetyl-D-glucosamine synthase